MSSVMFLLDGTYTVVRKSDDKDETNSLNFFHSCVNLCLTMNQPEIFNFEPTIPDKRVSLFCSVTLKLRVPVKEFRLKKELSKKRMT